MLIPALLVLLGFAALVAGAEGLVRGATWLALRLGVSPLVVGLTVVAFGTSAPELAVCVQAAWGGDTDLAVGNVVGSNIFNVAMILGVAALVYPIACHVAFIRREVPIMIGVGLLVPAFTLISLAPPGLTITSGWGIDRAEGVVLVIGILVYSFFGYRTARKDRSAAQTVDVPDEEKAKHRPVWLALLLMAAGIGGLVLGSDWMVAGASDIAETMGLSQLLIGLTIVAMGTSLPELATSVVAAIRKQPDITIGNVVGSNIFNVLLILGVTSLVRPLPVGRLVLLRDAPIMVFLLLLCLPLMSRRRCLGRKEGMLLLAIFVAYMGLLLWTEGALATLGAEPPGFLAPEAPEAPAG